MRHTRRDFLMSTAAGIATTSCSSTPPARRHIVLLGDSIFDNATYVPGRQSVIQLLNAELGERGHATLLAKDGDVTASVATHLAQLPHDATHLVISVGGNDALGHASLLNKPIANSADLLAELATIKADFRGGYARMLATVLGHGKPTAVCTVYDSNFDAPKKQLADVALAVWNDTILRCASDAGVPVIDLRRVFRERADYANAIEPSESGGAKIVKAIVRVTEQHDFTSRLTTLYA